MHNIIRRAVTGLNDAVQTIIQPNHIIMRPLLTQQTPSYTSDPLPQETPSHTEITVSEITVRPVVGPMTQVEKYRYKMYPMTATATETPTTIGVICR